VVEADARRETGPLSVGEDLAAVLARLRLAEGVSEKPELDVDAVRDVERGLGWRLPEDVLAVFAARVRRVETDHEMALAKVVGHTGRVRAAGATGDIIGVGKTGPRRWLCVRKGAQPAEGTELLVFDADEETLTGTTPLVDWLAEKAPEGAEGAPFEPVLVRKLPAGSPGQRVRHKTFGDGKVLKEVGSGPNRKVQVDFPGRGLKLLQARFLEFVD
jgi:hypothetical protein